MKLLTLCLVSALAAAGCATSSSVRPGTGGSTIEIRGKTYDEVWKAVVRVSGTTLTITESDRHSGTLRAEKAAGMATWGEVVGVFVRPLTPTAPIYTVEVQSRKRSVMQLTGQDWAPTLIAGIKAELDQ